MRKQRNRKTEEDLKMDKYRKNKLEAKEQTEEKNEI
jgi:hypothetical protein